MGSYVYVCPGCEGRFLFEESFLYHTETCPEYLALPPFPGEEEDRADD